MQMSLKPLDYQRVQLPQRNVRRFVWAMLFMLFPTLLLLSVVAWMVLRAKR
jgi:hypothetical protein